MTASPFFVILYYMIKKISVFIILIVVVGVVSAYVILSPDRVARATPMPAFGEVRVEHVAHLFYEGIPDGYIIIDARTEEEYAQWHTEGTVNFSRHIFEEDDACEKAREVFGKGEKIIIVCPYGPGAKEVYENLIDPVEAMGCGIDKEGIYRLWARVRFLKDRIIVKDCD